MLSQYANSPKYVALYNGLTDLFSNAKTLNDWFNVVYNLKTASGFGLDVWGAILNQDRSITYINEDTNLPETIYLKGALTADGISYTEEQIEEIYRQVLFLKAMSNITNATLKSLNDMLLYYYQNRGRAYALNYGTMEIRFVFEFFVNKLEKAIFTSDLMPRPTGVLMNFEFLPIGEYFGFHIAGVQPEDQPFVPFDNGVFYR